MDLKETHFGELRHPWELSRSERLFDRIKNYSKPSWKFLDVGAGDLFFTKKMASYSDVPVHAVDNAFLDDFLKKPIGKVECYRDFSELRDKTFDSIVMLDVLEHVENSKDFVRNLWPLLKDEGILFLTVPAHQFLFSDHDRSLGHFRRYGMKDLVKEFESFKYEILESHYFYYSLFIFRLLTLIFRKLFPLKKMTVESVGEWQFEQSHMKTKIVKKILDYDFKICRILSKIKIYPPGLSLCLILKKKSV